MSLIINCIQAIAVVIIMILCFIAGYEAGKNDAAVRNKYREYPVTMEHKHGK
jgi:hypothetical protein